jgi:hypothetical protein
MAKYSFYSINDSSKESIYTCDASSLEEARTIFARGKLLELETFDKLYSVKKYG